MKKALSLLKTIVKVIEFHYIQSLFSRTICNFLLLFSVWSTFFPTLMKKLYAEDGAVFLSDTYKYHFPLEFFEPVGGYSVLIMRIGGRFLRLFSLENAPLASTLFCAICLSILGALIFEYLEWSIESELMRFYVVLGFLFIPIANFSSVGSICNLYFYFMAASAVLIIAPIENVKHEKLRIAVLIIGALSLPVQVLLIPLLLIRIWLTKTTAKRIILQKADISWIFALFLQFVFILSTAFGQRLPHEPQSILKVIYLYLDRAIGISIIPGWGFVSGNAQNPQFDNTIYFHNLYFRFLLSFLSLLIFILIIYRSLSASKTNGFVSASIIGESALFTGVIGLFFNPEPRYMVFGSFCIIWSLFVALSTMPLSKFRKIVVLLYLVTILSSFRLSHYLSAGPEWKNSLALARIECTKNPNLTSVQVPISPTDTHWFSNIPCKTLNST